MSLCAYTFNRKELLCPAFPSYRHKESLQACAIDTAPQMHPAFAGKLLLSLAPLHPPAPLIFQLSLTLSHRPVINQTGCVALKQRGQTRTCQQAAALPRARCRQGNTADTHPLLHARVPRTDPGMPLTLNPLSRQRISPSTCRGFLHGSC